MSTTLCIKYALGHVKSSDVTWVFNELFGEDLVVKVTELVKQDRYSGKDFKIFFIECNKVKQTKGGLDKLARKIDTNSKIGDKKGIRVQFDKYGHYWQVSLAKEHVKEEVQAEFKPCIMEESEPTVQELEMAMEALQTKDELEILHGTKRGAEEGEIVETKRANAGQVITAKIAHDDPICQEALRDTIKHFRTLFPEKA